MRITSPDAGARMTVDDIDLRDARLYTDGDAHLAWRTLRAERPLHWTPARDGRPGFWSVTRRADVIRVLRDHEVFTSQRGNSLVMLGADDPAAGRMMVMTDPPRHGQLRTPLNGPLSAHAVPDYAGWIRDFVRAELRPVWNLDEFDAATTFARLPVATMVRLLDLPAGDVGTLVRIMYAAAASDDPAYQTGSARDTLRRAHYEIIDYFDTVIQKRRAAPGRDLLSHLLSVEFDGAPIDDETATANLYSLLLGATVTTSQAITAAVVALASQGDGVGRWSPDIPVASAVEETVRWASPSLQFTRYATEDVELHDATIRAGDAVAAWIPSANRDEAVFTDPYRFDPHRSPNRHVGFGTGVHRCVGNSLARLMLRVVVEEFFARIAEFELTGAPRHIHSIEIAGMSSVPMRIRSTR